jgi:hypothetical protein
VTASPLFRSAVLAVAAIGFATSAPFASALSQYVPGLGEFMSATQMRHAKLWFAGQARNWPLASYALDEIQEGFGDIVKLYPIHEGSPIPIKEILPRLTAAPLAKIRAAVSSEDKAQFEEAFDSLTEACNACHQAENFGFNHIIRPSDNPYSNQDFSVFHVGPPANEQKPNKAMKRTR